MSRNPSALASLTANYTDSENEDDQNSDENGHQTEDSNESQVKFTIVSQIETLSLITQLSIIVAGGDFVSTSDASENAFGSIDTI